MIIKPNKKRIEFERLLKKLGYKDNNPIIISKGPEYIQMLDHLTKNEIIVRGFIKEYKNKKSYLYEFFCTNYSNISKKEMKNQIKILCKDILFNEKTRIGEIGWRIENMIKLVMWNKKDKFQLLISVFKFAKISLKTGEINMKPNPGDILVSKPEGGKRMSPHPQAIVVGSSQRGRINKKLGFGKIKFNNSQYSRYDENLILRPI